MIVLTDDGLKEELLANTGMVNEDIVWLEQLPGFDQHPDADVVIDLLFDETHITALRQRLPTLIMISSVVHTLQETDTRFVRINGWPGFLKSELIEASSIEENRKRAEEVFSFFNKKIEWLPDEIGFVTPRIISMIINEAFIAEKEGVSTREEIDIAMKLGTNYPYGPFEWAQKIGADKVSYLLEKLSRQQVRYTPFIF